MSAVVRRRLLPFDARFDRYSWIATGAVVLVAAILRLVGLGHPKGKIFDELYYADHGWGLIDRGVEWNYEDNAPYYVVHPPLGKWLIGLGEWAFGYQDAENHIDVRGHIVTTSPEFAWRISAAIAGVVSVLILTRLARRLFHSTTLGCAAGLLMALDGMHFVMSRTALLDIFLMLFVLAAFAALVMDRDARRKRWLTAMAAGLDPGRVGKAGRPPFTFPGAVPWWRLLAAVLLGCALAVKWSAVWFVPGFALLALVWEAGARRSAGVRRPWRDAIIDEFGWFLLCGVLILATYLASWTGWFLTDDGYFRHWLADHDQSEPRVLGALQNLYQYHVEALRFHTGLGAHHKYQSWPWQWLLLGRPVAFYWSSTGNCGASNCAAEVVLIGTPVLWWSFLPALGGLAWFGISRRDWRAIAIGASVAAALLPWFYFALDGRTMFYFYALPAEPFLVLAVVYVLGAIMTPQRATPPGRIDRRLVGAVIAGSYLLLVAVCFAYFYPLYTGQLIPYADWSARMWLGGRWI
ncbi:MAG TPA: phospholipid carrier-dependent glycosyltransferase [Micromonosporaceae bacterium]|nr:phospholipid carrier-dependent glycosyltransferase [Micromonosporaceae bacterium]